MRVLTVRVNYTRLHESNNRNSEPYRAEILGPPQLQRAYFHNRYSDHGPVTGRCNWSPMYHDNTRDSDHTSHRLYSPTSFLCTDSTIDERLLP